MSKIEEALIKAKKLGTRNLTGIKPVNEEQIAQKSSMRSLIPAHNSNTSNRLNKSSSKEIALMENGELLDNNALTELKIIYSEMPDHKTANTYRDLRTKLIQKTQGQNFIALVTSCVPGTDSSSTVINLSTAFSFDESKTSLIVDCNLNNPYVDTLLNIDTKKGLTDYLENESLSTEEILYKTGIKRLKIIPAGSTRETATEYFTSLRMRELLAGLLSRYTDRYIFIDSPPVTDFADTRILVELCDIVLLVVPYGKATKSIIKKAANAIGEDKLLGIVFNDAPHIPNLFRKNRPNNES